MAVCLSASAARAAGKAALWIADANDDQVDEYLPAQLQQSGNTPVRITLPIGSAPYGVCFDASNNLWVVDAAQQILKFRAQDLKKLQAIVPSPAVTIGSSSFGDINGCAFDSHGNLWVVDENTNSLYKISAHQLQTTNLSITPAVVISSDDMAGAAPGFVTFDHQGNLWTDGRDTEQLYKFGAGQLTSSGNKHPKVILSGGGSLSDPGQIGFDPQGNLWVPSYEFSTVVMFKKSQLGKTNNDAPAVTISSASLFGPWGLAFHGAQLWILDYSDGEAQEFLHSQIKSSGSPAANVELTGAAAVNNWGITFGPAFGTPQ